MAQKLSVTVAHSLGIRDRGAKTEKESQHPSLAVMEFDKCWLIELGFLDNPVDRSRMLDPIHRKVTCEALARVIQAYV
jgi:N-acetylmuramoyl-L-alanine amidase